MRRAGQPQRDAGARAFERPPDAFARGVKIWLSLLKPHSLPWPGVILYVGAVGASGGWYRASPWLLIGLALIYMGGSSALNDYMDRDRDRLNHPDRAIPSGFLSASQVLGVAILLSVGGLLLIVVSEPLRVFWLVTLVFAATEAVHVLIYGLGANRIGPLARSALVSLVIVVWTVGAAAVVGKLTSTVWLSAGLVSLMHFFVLPNKDLSDVEGDRRTGALTFAVVHGRRNSLLFTTVGAAVTYAVTAALVLEGIFDQLALPVLAVGALLLGASTALSWRREHLPHWNPAMILSFLSVFVFMLAIILGVALHHGRAPGSGHVAARAACALGGG